MGPEKLTSARKAAGLTQQRAAERLGVSQAYVALLERGRRPVTPGFALRIVKVYQLGPTALRLHTDGMESWDSASFATALARLGYPGFVHLRHGKKRNPAVILLGAIAASDLEVRVIEALPWLVLEYGDLDWDWLIRESKVRDAQNRLGFLVTLALQVAERRGDHFNADNLRHIEDTLNRARLVRQDTLCQSSLSQAERRWLRQSRPAAARHWNLLTDLESRYLPDVA